MQNKKTYLILKALEIGSVSDRQKLEHWMNTPTTDATTKIAQVKNLLQQLDIQNLAQQPKQEFQDLAFTHLQALSVPAKNREALETLAHGLLDRAF